MNLICTRTTLAKINSGYPYACRKCPTCEGFIPYLDYRSVIAATNANSSCIECNRKSKIGVNFKKPKDGFKKKCGVKYNTRKDFVWGKVTSSFNTV